MHVTVKEKIDILVAATKGNDKAQRGFALKNSAPFRSCITKTNNTLIDKVEDLDIVMLLYNLLGYSNNYTMMSGSLWNYYRDETDNVDDNACLGKSFKCKIKIVGKPASRTLKSGNRGDADGPV